MRVTNGTSMLLCGLAMLSLAACAKTDKSASPDSTKPASATAVPTQTSASYADFAGDWNMRAVPETGNDTTPTEFVLHASADSTAWKVAYKKGPTLPIKVSLSGDSIIVDTPEHMSMRGRGKLTTRAVYRRTGDKLVGRITAHYAKGPDSVRTLRADGTKAQ